MGNSTRKSTVAYLIVAKLANYGAPAVNDSFFKEKLYA
ncbi:hypothetical protein EMIT0P100_90175 [Pseudomonas sp. IT-P100]